MTTNGMQSVTQRASDFAARLYSGAMAAEDERELEAWLAENPSHKVEYQAVLDTWYNMGDLSSDEEVLGYAEEDYAANDSGWGRWPKLAAVAGLVMAVTVGLFNVIYSEPELMSYASAVGERKTITLSDGSEMTLNTNSRVLIDYTDGHRRAILDRGEAFFAVAKDAERPFTVDAGAHTATVLGTSFNVYRASGKLEIAVAEGMVAVHQSENGWANGKVPEESMVREEQGQYLMKAGSVITYRSATDRSPEMVHDETRVKELSSWLGGSLRFNHRPLVEVIGEMNRYSRKKILIEDTSIMDMDVSAVVQLNDLAGALDGMESVFPLDVAHYSDRIVLTGRNNRS